MISGAEIMVKCLEAEGVDIVFGYPGAAICPFYDKIYDSSITHILVRQEQNAAHAASGYARCSNRPGVCVATSVPVQPTSSQALQPPIRTLFRLLPLQVRFVPTFSAEMSFRKLTSRELVNRL